MKIYRYSVTLETPIGIRHGVMTAQTDDSSVTGVLHIMQADNPFNGEIIGNICHIRGKLKTLVSSVSYTAEGILDSKCISLELITAKHQLILRGGAENA